MSLISSRQSLPELPADLPWGEFACAIVESPADIQFLEAEEVHQGAARSFPRGVAFGGASELRWLQRDSGYHVVYISDADSPLAGATHRHGLERVDVGEPDHLLLWGERGRDSEVLFTDRIPRPLRYPGPVPAEAHRAALQVRHYFLGETRFYRFVRLIWL